MTIIVLGEVILSTVLAIHGAMASSSGDEGSGGHTAPYAVEATGSVGPEMLPLIIGGLIIVFAMWWLYFKRENADLVEDDRTVGLVLSAAVVIFLLCLGGLHAIHADRPEGAMVPVVALSAAVVAVPLLGMPVQWTVLVVGLLLSAAVAEHVVASGRKVTA